MQLSSTSFREKSHADLLKPAHKIWNISVRDASKIDVDHIDCRALYFRQDVLANSIIVFKSYLSEKIKQS